MTGDAPGQDDGASRAAPRRRSKADWEAIERDYRLNQWTDQELTDKHGNVVSRQAVTKRAKVKGWTKDLSLAVRHATKNALIVAAGAAKVAEKVAEGCEATKIAVAAVVEVNKAVILSHRAGAKRAQDVTRGILEELADAAALDAHRELLAEILAGEEADEKKVADARDAIVRALGIGARAATAQKLTDALAKAQAMERVAHGLDKAGDGDGMTTVIIKDQTGRAAVAMER